MSSATKCDRCGEFFIENTYRISYSIFGGIKPVRLRLIDTRGNGVGRDLCDKCWKELDDFLKAYQEKPEESTDEKEEADETD